MFNSLFKHLLPFAACLFIVTNSVKNGIHDSFMEANGVGGKKGRVGPQKGGVHPICFTDRREIVFLQVKGTII